jgi:hypothetical protein
MAKKVDLTGQKFGRLTVIEFAGRMENRRKTTRGWRCVCDCGKEVIVDTNALRSGNTTGCLSCWKVKDETGNRYGRVTVIGRGHKASGQGVLGGGYINPMLEKGLVRKGASLGNCKDQDTAKKYGEKCFANYTSGGGLAYIEEQVLNFQKEGGRIGQKCVPVDIDNCDSIGTENYKSILDTIEKLNNLGDVKIKVLAKNPHLSGCMGKGKENFFNHPAVIGAFVESATKEEAKQLDQMRKPGQVLLFAAGSGSKVPESRANKNLGEIEKLNIPNSAYSYDRGKEYQSVYKCSYHE